MTNFPDDSDGAVLKSLAKHGVDLSKSLEIEFAMTAPDEQGAKDIAAAFAAAGYDAEISYDDGEPDPDGQVQDDEEGFGPSWAVFVAVEMVPEYQRLVDIQAELKTLAQPLGGKPDGWGVLI